MSAEPTSRTFTTDGTGSGQRLDQQLATWLDDSRSQVAKRIDDGDVLVNGQVASRSHRLVEGDVVVVHTDAVVHTPAPPVPPIVWEDEHLLVIDKPAGLVVHPGSGRPDGTLVDALLAAGIELAAVGEPDRPGIVHRLDLGTSGLMLVARTVAAHEGLTTALRRREVVRRYLALAAGELPAPSGRIEVPLGRDPHLKVRYVGDSEGRRAVTHWRTLATGSAPGGVVSLVACRLETGRTHQIRAHLRHVGAPVVGDTLYDGPGDLGEDVVVERPLLHAALLSFAHPVTGAPVVVTTVVPDDLARVATAVGIDVPDPATIWATA